MTFKKTTAIIIVFVMTLAIFTACGGGFAQKHTSAGQAAPEMAAAAPSAVREDMLESGFSSNRSVANMQPEEYDMADDSGGGEIAGPSVTPVIDSRKIIKNVDLQLQTISFDSGVDTVAKMAEGFGGYVQDSYVQGRDMYNERGARTANFTIRIPAEKIDAFVNSIGGEFNVISKSQNSQDITETYFDSRARLDALKVQEERLLTMLEGAAELEYMLQIEKELMNVRYEIESLTSALNRMDNYVSLSTVTIYLIEVVKYEPVEDVPVTFAARISQAFTASWSEFSDFCQSFAVIFVSVFPFLLMIAVIIIIIIPLARRAGKKREARRAEKQKNMPAYAPYQAAQGSRDEPDLNSPKDETDSKK